MHTVSMPAVKLGSDGLLVSAVGLGCMSMCGELYGPADHDASLATLRRAVDEGVTLLDTSDAYGIGSNERLLGEFLATARRDELVVSTKFGSVRKEGVQMPLGIRGDAEYVREACDASLRRLGVDHIDLYSPHFPDPKVPIEETVVALAGLVEAGKIRHVGLSNVTAQQVEAAHAVYPISAVENEWSLFSREAEDELVPLCARLGIGFVPYAPLGRGFLTGSYNSTEGLAPNDFRRAVPRFNGTDIEHNLTLLQTIKQVAHDHNATPGQVSLAWLHARGGQLGLAVVPIPGTVVPEHAAQNAAAAALRLTESDLDALDALAAQVRGAAWPPLPPAVAAMFGRQPWTEPANA